ncbi:hypothetical protein [Vannielia litorea]|uniref:hypothetical protein n=1 Tax=Vannielia litorea TaxID=1217970 RepID=UPI001BCF6C33|nr:hypothetical protein [Vannielia litorea]MBS8227136.1 hypothetical protein [Vannielia litorea]
MNLPAKVSAPSLLMDPTSFDHMQRVGKMLALSPLFPDHLRKGSQETAIANGVLIMNMAARLNEDPLTVAQNIYFVSGKPGWSASYMIGKANQHGVFKNPISWEVEGKGGELSVTAFAELAATGKRVQVTCDMAMAKAEGWTKNSKYQSMPEQMLRYRSATFLIRLYCPEVMVGVPSQVEIELGMKDVTPDDYAAMHAQDRKPESQAEPEDAEVVPADEEEPEDDEGQAELEALRADFERQTGEKPDGRWGTDRLKEEVAKAQAAKAEDPTPAKEEPAEGFVPKAVSAPSGGNAPDPEQFRGLLNMIKRDLMDAGSVADVVDLYSAQLDQMKTVAPEMFAELEEEFEAYRAQERAD